MRCECGLERQRNSSTEGVCGAEGFDHYEEYCCNCMQKCFNWVDYDVEACRQCKARREAEKKEGK